MTNPDQLREEIARVIEPWIADNWATCECSGCGRVRSKVTEILALPAISRMVEIEKAAEDLFAEMTAAHTELEPGAFEAAQRLMSLLTGGHRNG